MGLGLYIHIPFCRQKCFYCDFPSRSGSIALQRSYTEALCREIAAQGASLAGEKVDTVYIGGGTPTVLADDLLAGILQAVQNSFALAPAAECTIEANPGTVTMAKLQLLRNFGVNRISFGVQSFDDELLLRIGRIHTAAEAQQAIALAKKAGFANISLDLMYGLPGQTMAALQHSVTMALSQGVQHISIYGLQVEEGTAFAEMQAQGRLALPDDEAVEQMYEYITQELPNCGYERYEISNFARPEAASRHNLSYWQDKPYIGLGAAAHSYYRDKRWENISDVNAYIAGVKLGKSVAAVEEEMSRAVLMEEFCFLALRTKWGIDAARFDAKFGCALTAVHGEKIRRLQEQGLLAADMAQVHLTDLGMKYGNVVFAEFLLASE